MIAGLSFAGLSIVQVWLTDVAFLASALLAAALVLRLVLRDAKSRVLLAWGTWLGIAGAAAVTLLPGWPRYEWDVVKRLLRAEPVAAADAESPLPIAFDWGLPLDSSTESPDDQLAQPLTASPQRDWRGFVTLAWVSGALAGLAWIALGCWQARKLLRHSQSAPRWIIDELAQVAAPRQANADVRTSSRLASAVALRARRPIILLPNESVEPSNAAAVRAALAHEWAHIRHGDLWLLALERLLLPLLALHPLFWWLRRSTRLDQELLADAVAAGDKPVEYAEALVAWAKSSAPPPVGIAALAFWDRPSNLTRRVHMILNKPRSASTWFGRVLSVVALSILLVLVGGLSVITLRPLAAEDEPKQPAPAPVVEHPIDLGPALPPATSASHIIELSCIVLELEPAEMAKVLSGGEHPALPSPAVELGIQAADEWSETLKKLEANPSVRILSRPRIRTLNNRQASVEIDVAGVKIPGLRLYPRLKVDLQPELLPSVGDEQQLLLSIAFERMTGHSTGNPGKSANPMMRKVQTKVAVPLGKVVVVADPSNRSPVGETSGSVLLVVHPRLVAEWEATRPATPEEVEAASRREAAAVRHTLLRLQREIASLLEQTAGKAETAADPTVAPKAQNPLLEKSAEPVVIVFTVQGDRTEVLKQLQRRMKELKIEGVKVAPDWNSEGLMVSGPQQQVGEIRKLLFEIDRTAATTSEQRLQQKLLELDLREAEINLQSAEAEHGRYADMRNKNPGAVSETELQHSRLKVELAKIQVERMRVRLEAAQRGNPPATPALPRR